jgi:hypothetical protein
MEGYMKRLIRGTAGLALVCLLGAPAVHAQGAQFSLGGGLGVPLGDFDEAAGLGWHGLAALYIVPNGWPVGIQIDGSYQQFSLSDDFLGGDGLKSRLIQGTANIVFSFNTEPDATFRPYLIGGGGVYNDKVTGQDDAGEVVEGGRTNFGINAGAGFNFGAGGAALFIEGRFHNIFSGDESISGSNLQFIPITLGIRLGGGS